MIIKNALLLTWSPQNILIPSASLRIRGGIISDIFSHPDNFQPEPGEEIIDAHDQIVMPGIICAHTHFYGAYARGLGIPGTPPKNFPEILQKLWWKLDRALSLQDVYYSAMVCLVDAIRHGTTTLIDHHASQNAIDGSLDEIANAVDECGLRAVLCYEVTDRDGPEKAIAGIKENLRFYSRISSDPFFAGKIGALFGLHASLTLSDKTLERCQTEAANRLGYHIHVAEDISDQGDSLAKSGLRVVERLNRFGILGPDTIVVHGVHLDTSEIQRLVESKTWVTHQPRSNMNNAVGMANVVDMLQKGVRVCLGNDGFSNAMWDEWRITYLVHKLWNRDPQTMNGWDVIRMAVDNNALLANHILGGEPLGIITPGARADLIFVDYHPFTPLEPGNIPWHILFGFRDSMVTTTIVGGKVLMRDRQLVCLDEERIISLALERSKYVWQKFNDQF
ncbi:MAG TPA: putative aminohydrolase SsnA [Anaerolineaceae bacterium]